MKHARVFISGFYSKVGVGVGGWGEHQVLKCMGEQVESHILSIYSVNGVLNVYGLLCI